ncbi:YolD-like family protein [Neobacillus sp. OS1-33]|uniref:YolD-like family protein n=1 Tax=Neobacillus sp. OS1-33 TaxID=3070683 RepID=UPI0027E1A956|nr:YolD-like family protein [Neobacillus sp. OS1-33]WML24116.1 YolD-like family protein [Neobacillus sp. OS1-33]
MAKPVLDDYQTVEFDLNIAYAMEYNLVVKLKVCEDGFTKDMTGQIINVDPITHQLKVEVKPGVFEPVTFEDVVRVVVLD